MEYEDAAPVCCLGWVACGGELPVAEGTCANSRAGLNLLFFLYKWQKLTFGSAGAHLEHILASCWYYPLGSGRWRKPPRLFTDTLL